MKAEIFRHGINWFIEFSMKMVIIWTIVENGFLDLMTIL